MNRGDTGESPARRVRPPKQFRVPCPTPLCRNKLYIDRLTCTSCRASYRFTVLPDQRLETATLIRVAWECVQVPGEAPVRERRKRQAPVTSGLSPDQVRQAVETLHVEIDTLASRSAKDVCERTLPDLLEGMQNRLLSAVDAEVKGVRADLDAVGEQLKAVRPLQIKIDRRKPLEIQASDRHVAYPEIMHCLASNGRCLLVGPPGTGKTTLARQIAQDVALPFGYLACTEGMSEAHILGRMNAAGDYLPSPFVRMAPEGCVFLFDEIDAMDPNAALSVNEALANGEVCVPNRVEDPYVKLSERTWILGAANTYGTGNSMEHTGRNALDAAFLDRFAGLIVHVDYDTQRERGIAAALGTEPLLERIWKIRDNVRSSRIRRAVSTRALIHLSQLHAQDPEQYPQHRIIERLFLGWSDTERSKALQGVA